MPIVCVIAGTKANCGEVVSIVNDKGRYHSLIATALPPGSEDVRDFLEADLGTEIISGTPVIISQIAVLC